jgi:hypothetical protein
MVRRLLVGLVLGLVVGGLVAAGLVQGLHVLQFGDGTGGALFAYLAAAVTGVLTGLVAGKPIWAAGARIEAGLKAFFGALLAAGLMFALRQWAGGVHLPVSELTPEGLAIGSLPIASLPVVAALLGGFFEIDNTGGDDKDAKKDGGAKKRVAAEGANGKSKARVAEGDDDGEADEGAAAPPKRAKR